MDTTSKLFYNREISKKCRVFRHTISLRRQTNQNIWIIETWVLTISNKLGSITPYTKQSTKFFFHGSFKNNWYEQQNSCSNQWMIGIDTQDTHPRGCVLSRGGNSDLYLIKHELCTWLYWRIHKIQATSEWKLWLSKTTWPLQDPNRFDSPLELSIFSHHGHPSEFGLEPGNGKSSIDFFPLKAINYQREREREREREKVPSGTLNIALENHHLYHGYGSY